MKRKALGKGLSSLIPKAPPRDPARRDAAAPLEREIDIDLIRPNRDQPRERFDEESLEALAESFRSRGVLQPVLLRPAGEGKYELVAGERRWRAAQRAGLLKIPAVVRNIPDDRLLETALIENLQRENLNPIEEALAYRQLMDERGLTHQDVADAVGKQRATISNALRLLNLSGSVQEKIRSGKLPMGHARAIAALKDPVRQESLAERVIREGLSVRQVESIVGRAEREAARGSPRQPAARDPHVASAEEKLQAALGTKVRILNAAGRGRLEIYFYSDEELRRLYDVIEKAVKPGARIVADKKVGALDSPTI